MCVCVCVCVFVFVCVCVCVCKKERDVFIEKGEGCVEGERCVCRKGKRGGSLENPNLVYIFENSLNFNNNTNDNKTNISKKNNNYDSKKNYKSAIALNGHDKNNKKEW